VVIDGIRHLGQPGTIFGQFQEISRGVKFDAVGRGIAQRFQESANRAADS
jgi:hypothetical protein